ncbi:hypothetical protein D7Y06_16795 [Roseburia sp. 1XD42-69]|nr:glycoside hydrolase family 2 protein [Roseburia sp. 1XD42-69]RKJ62661.1 hypothetical protein D7Y06_16795 [Roseburia sp. 1XD42-69]
MEKVNLNGVWDLKQIGGEREYRAKIPGSVLSGLLEEKAIPNPYYGRNEYQVRDLFWNDYEFSRKFQVDKSLLDKEQVELVCLGIDTIADIYINNSMVFHVENMHRTWRIPVKEYLLEGNNEIRIVFPSILKYMESYKYEENKEVTCVPCGCMMGNHLVRKAHSMFGWDWGPQLPDAGIFRDIYFEGFTGRRIFEVRLHQHHENDRVKLNAVAEFTHASKGQEEQQVLVSVRDTGTGEILQEKKSVLEDKVTWEGEFLIENPKLWWPNGYGEQPLYEVSVCLLDDKGTVLEEEKKTVGLRTMEISREKDQWGREFAFVVNGLKIFAMGGDYIPEDCVYSHITKERQEYLLDSACRAHFNCIRVWGGGYYPSDDFYEMCDRKGIIVWQDLMFACNVYDVTDAFLENCRQEIVDNVKRLRHHPSLGLWCGNNEIESGWNHWESFQEQTMYLRADYIKLFEHMIPDVMKKTDPDTFFWPSSPSAGGCFANTDDENDGDAHYWDVWHAPSWSSVDYFGRWKALQYMACRFFAPVTASIITENHKVCLYIENETENKVFWQGEILLKNMDMEVIHKVTAQSSTGDFRSEKVLEMGLEEMNRLKLPDREENLFFEGRVTFEDNRTIKNIETPVPFKYLQMKPADIKAEVYDLEDGYEIRLFSQVFAAFVELDFEDADVIFPIIIFI